MDTLATLQEAARTGRPVIVTWREIGRPPWLLGPHPLHRREGGSWSVGHGWETAIMPDGSANPAVLAIEVVDGYTCANGHEMERRQRSVGLGRCVACKATGLE